MRKSLYILFTTTLALSACTVGEDYQPPKPDLDATWHAAEATTAPSQLKKIGPTAPWWLQFSDGELNQLMANALANNNDLKTADVRVAEARANEDHATAELFPEISATASGTRQHLPASSGNVMDRNSQYGLHGTWDLDLFGGNRRHEEAATAKAESEEAHRDKTQLDLLTDTARNYIILRSLQQQRALTLKNLSMQQDTLKVTTGQREEGAVSDLEVARAAAQVSATEARLPQIQTAEYAALNRLCVLTDQKYDALKYLVEEKKSIPYMLQKAVTQTPIATIAKRPDVRASERDLAANTALTGEALTAFYPKLSLEGFFGPQTSQFFGNSTPWSATTNAVLPLLNFGRLSSQLDAANARQQQTFYTYQQTVLLAVEDTENAFAAYINEQRRRQSLKETAAQQAKAATIARELYRSGVTTQLDLLIAESNQLQAETDLTQSEQSVAENIIKLHQALGDGIEY